MASNFELFSKNYFRKTFSQASNADGKVCPCGLLIRPCNALPWHPHGWPRLPTRGHSGLFHDHYIRATFSRASNANGKVCPCGVLMRTCIALAPRKGGQGFQHGGIPVFFPSITFRQRFHEHPMPMARFARVVSLCGLALPCNALAPAQVAKASNMGAFWSFF